MAGKFEQHKLVDVSDNLQAVLLHLANLGVRDLKGIAGFHCHANKK